MDFKNTKIAILEAIPMIGLFFAPAFWIIIILLMLMFADTWHGLKKARYLKEEITTNRASDFFAKLIGYGVFIIIGLAINNEFKITYGVWLLAIIPAFIEIKSIDENQRKRGKKGIIKQIEEVYRFALKIKKKRDELR